MSNELAETIIWIISGLTTIFAIGLDIFVFDTNIGTALMSAVFSCFVGAFVYYSVRKVLTEQ